MKLLSQIFNLGLVGLTASPLTVLNTNQEVILNKHNTEESKMRCTITYVGKDCTSDGLAIIARSTDAGPRASNSKLIKYKHNERANATLKNVNGFEYKLPSETYAYIAAPDSPFTDPKGDENQFENFGINEMGVGLSCTLTCFTNETAATADYFMPNGINEEMFNQVIIPQASTARQAMEIAAKVIDAHGSAEANIIMAIDQNEAWLMEIYTAHQYCAVKLPDDKMCVVGNEFFLNTLDELGISELNKENCIVSNGLLSLPVEKGFAKFDKSGIQDVYHLDLFNTYARALGVRDAQGKEISNTDGSHMRTWRGFSLFDPTGDIAKDYVFDEKFPAFFIPRDENGDIRGDITTADVMQIFRDEYDNIIGKEGYERFTKAKQNNTLVCIPGQTTRSIHIMTSNPTLPKEIACNTLYCPSSANYSPYVIINNGMDSIDGEYGYWPDRYEYDDYCSATLFRRLNALAWLDRTNYGFPVQDYCRAIEYIINAQMLQVINDASKLNINDAKNIITNFNKHLRDVNIQAVKDVTHDLTWHIMNQPASGVHLMFTPLIDLEAYLTNLGWTNFKKEGNIITFKYKDSNGKLDLGEGYYREKGTITIDNVSDTINLEYRNNRTYVDINKLNTLIRNKAAVQTINIYDYLSKGFNHWVWIGPMIAVIVLAGGIVIYLLFKKKKPISKQSLPEIVEW